MKVITKRALALLMSLMLMVSLFVGLTVPAQAATVEYKYSGKYIYNWGTRGTTATFLSPNAIKFYQDNGVSFEQLAGFAGTTSTSTGTMAQSNLFKQLHTLIYGNLDYKTSYDATRDLFKYTDSQNNIKDSTKISSFYSGKAIGPGWDSGSTWNREHCWPNSKSAGGSGSGGSNTVRETDIMMLRPTASSENGSRGNKAYGESSGYYNPNEESGGKYDLRGDVARIVLYVFTCWVTSPEEDGARNYFWGSSGVIESKDVLLKWMAADPVDTWELGRNDSVEAITGTRNVFVDYPELAFEMFETKIPANFTTPSGKAAGLGGSNYPNTPDQPDIVLPDQPSGGDSTGGFVTEPKTGVAYKLGLNQTNKGAVYYFTGAMSNYYGATDTSFDAGTDVTLETATGGYYLTFNDGAKKYINLVFKQDGEKTYYNFTFDTTATSVFTWDSAKNALTTTVNGETCYIGTYADYVTMGVLTSTKLKDTDYIARLYASAGSSNPGGSNPGGSTPDTPVAGDPIPNSTLTIPQASALGASKAADVYTEGKYYVTGVIKSVDSDIYGNMTLQDANGNTLYVYGTHSTDGSVRYDALDPRPVAGDTVTLYGIIGQHNNVPQMKDGWITAHTPGDNPAGPSTPTTGVKIFFENKDNRIDFSGDKQVWTENGITVTNEKAGSTTAVGDYAAPGRFYKGSSVKIEYPGMKKITIKSVVYSDKDYAAPWAESVEGISGATATTDGDTVTITFASPVNSLTIPSMTAQARAYYMIVDDGKSQPTTHTHKYDNDCDATCNDCGAVRIASHAYDNGCDADCNKCGATREVAHSYDDGNDTECNECGATREGCTHKYDNDCDATCNLCGYARTVAHKYDNGCDTKCNVCGAERTAEHTYDNGCDTKCNVCGAERTAQHEYDHAFDTTCNNCGAIRELCEHLFNSACDKTCNLCGFVRAIAGHKFDNVCDKDCDYCGAVRAVMGHKYADDNDADCDRCGTVRLIITAKPKHGFAKLNGIASTIVKAKGDGLTYTWYVKEAGATKYVKSKITSNKYTVKMTDKVSGRRVYCVVKDKYGNKVQTNSVLLRTQATITKEPSGIAYAQKGNKVTIKLTAKGTDLTYQWYYKNAGSTKYSKSSVNSATYTTTMSAKSKGRRVYCVVKDKYGKTVQSKTFIMREAVSVISQPKSKTVAKNNYAKVTVKASGVGLKYTWYVKEAGSSKYVKSRITSSTYSVKMTKKVSGRYLYCVVTDQYGKTVQTKTVRVKMK